MGEVAWGHNGPPVYESAEDLPPGLPKMHYFKCDIEALWGVLVEMPMELGGFYMRALLAMYKHMEGLPADDNVARMRLGGMDIRTYRRMKAALLGRHKCFIEKPSGRISNERFEEEVTSYVTEFRNRQRAAVEREEKRKTQGTSKRTSAGLPPDFQPTSGELPAKVQGTSGKSPVNIQGDLSEKTNEINGGTTTTEPELSHSATTTDALRARVLELELEKRRESKQSSLDSESAREAAAAEAKRLRADSKNVARRLEEAAGPALASFASFPGLIAINDPIAWVAAGADFELDVLPAIAHVAAKRPPGSIKAWAYFSSAVADFKASRERGLPPPSAGIGKEQPTARKRLPPGMSAGGMTVEEIRRRDEEEGASIRALWQRAPA